MSPQPCTVLIAAPPLQAPLRQRAGRGLGDILAFGDADALRALDVIAERQPQVVVLERLFAETPRGAALINRLTSDPALSSCEIRVVAHDSDYRRISPRRAGPPVAPLLAVATVAAPLDQRGTRRAPRTRMPDRVTMLVDGSSAPLVDLSTVGAQVVSATILKPNQRVRLALPDAAATIRFNGVVAWASFEIPSGGSPRYRAGIEFLDADPAAVAAFVDRQRAS
jgi:hypothetical protein